MRSIAAGKLRHPIVIQQPTPGAADEFGRPAITWPKFCSSWASVEPISGSEIEVARTYAPTVSHRITLRYVAGILPTFRVCYAGRNFNINAVLNIEERQRMLVLMCSEQITT